MSLAKPSKPQVKIWQALDSSDLKKSEKLNALFYQVAFQEVNIDRIQPALWKKAQAMGGKQATPTSKSANSKEDLATDNKKKSKKKP